MYYTVVNRIISTYINNNDTYDVDYSIDSSHVSLSIISFSIR